VVVLRIFTDRENHAHLRIEASTVERREVCLRIEDQPVGSRRQWFFQQEKGFHSPFFICPGVRELFPALIALLTFKIDSYSVGRLAAGCVENVG
jgi:hypothetical protein